MEENESHPPAVDQDMRDFLINLGEGERDSDTLLGKKYGGTTDQEQEEEQKEIEDYIGTLSEKFPGLFDFLNNLKDLKKDGLLLTFIKTMINPNRDRFEKLMIICKEILKDAKEPSSTNPSGSADNLDKNTIITQLLKLIFENREELIKLLDELLDENEKLNSHSGGDNGNGIVEGPSFPIERGDKQNWKTNYGPKNPRMRILDQTRLDASKFAYRTAYNIFLPLSRGILKVKDVVKYSKRGRNYLKSISIITQIYTVIRYTFHKQIYITIVTFISAASSGALLKLNLKSLVLAIMNTGYSTQILFIAPIATMISQYFAHFLYSNNEIKPIKPFSPDENRHNSLCYFKNNIQLYNILDTKFIRNLYLGSYIVITDKLRENIELYIDETHKKKAILNTIIDIILAYNLNEEFKYEIEINQFINIQKIINKAVTDIRSSYRKEIYADIMTKNYKKSYEELKTELENILDRYTTLNLAETIDKAEKRGKNEANKTKIDIFHIRCIRPIDFKRMSDSWSSKFEDLKYTYCVFFSAEELYLKIHNMEPGGSMFNMYSDDIKYLYKVMPIECLENRKLRVPKNWLQKNYLSSYIFNTTKYEILLFINDIFKDIHDLHEEKDDKFNIYYNEYFNMIKQIYNIFNINIEKLNDVIVVDEELAELKKKPINIFY